MKKGFILLTTALLMIHLSGFAQKVSFRGKNVPLQSAFDAIKIQTGYGFFYDEELLSLARPITVDLRNEDLSAFLKAIFANQPLQFTIRNGTIIVSEKKGPVSAPAPPEPIQIYGQISAESGENLAGVLIRTSRRAALSISDHNGRYSIEAAPDESITFSHIGFEAVQYPAAGREVLNVSLQRSKVDLGEIVVVGYGEVAQRDVTGAIASVGSVQIRQRSPTNLFDALQGQSPGIEVNQQDGRAGAQSSITIRGIGTLGSGVAPLYIVDGAQNVNIDGINPLDIARVEILKDAASAAIYGTRGANGVILITTKRGLMEGSRIEGTMLSTFGRIAHKVPVANAAERRLFEKKISGASGDLPTDSLTPGRNADNDPYDFVTRTARRTDVNLSMGGASQWMKYYASIGYFADESVVVNQWARQGRGRINLDFQPSARLSIRNNLQFSLRRENLINERSVLHHALARIPYFPYYYADGSFAPTMSGRRNPLANALLQKNLNQNYSANIFNMAQYRVNKDLLFTADASLAFEYANLFSFTPRILNACTSCVNPNNSAYDNSSLRTSWITQAYLSYDKQIGRDHKLTALLGTSAEGLRNRVTQLSGSDFISEEVTTINAAQVLGVPFESVSENGAVSVFSRLGYNYKGRYQLNGILRADASSRFGKDSRWGYFPSVSAAWTFSQEPFMQWTSGYLSNAKIRGGYGIVGNDQSLGDYDAIQQYVFGNQFYNGVSGVSMSSIYGNNFLSWETNKQFNVGMDLLFFSERLKFVADYYKKTTVDLLYPAPLPLESGFNRVSVNLGSIENKGFEFLISGTPLSRGGWTWNINYNIAFNRGMVRKLANGVPIESGAGSLTEVGQPLGNFFGWRQLRVFPYDESNAFTENIEALTPHFRDGQFTGYSYQGTPYHGLVRQKQTNGLISTGGDVDWEDLNRDGIIDDEDRSILGNAQPDYTFGLNSSLGYQGLTFSFSIYGSMGGEIYNAALANQTRYTDTGDTPPPAWIYGAWFNPGDMTDMPKAKTGSSIGNARAISSRYIEDGSFIRLRNIRLQYEIPHHIISRIGALKASFFIQGNNLMTYSNYQHFDPEMSRSNPLSLGVDGEGGTPRIPRKNEIMFGLNATF